MDQPEYFRIAIVSPNKAQKHLFINTFFSDSFYPQNIIKKQKYVLVLKKNPMQTPVSTLHRVTPAIQSNKFKAWTSKTQNLAQSPLIPKYLDYFANNICNYSVDEESVFVVQTSSIHLKMQYYTLEVYDIPLVKPESESGCILIDDSEQSLHLAVDIIIVVLSNKDCFSQNTEVMKNYVGNNKIAKVWVVVGDGIKQEDIPLVGENHKIVIESTMEKAIEGVGKIISQVEEKCLEELSKMVCVLPPKTGDTMRTLEEEDLLIPSERDTKRMIESIQDLDTLPAASEISAIPTKPVLLLTPSDLSNLTLEQLRKLHILLTRDISRLPVQQYNDYLKQIGYTRFIRLPELSFKLEIICLVGALILSLILGWWWVTGASLLIGLIAILSKAVNHNKSKKQAFQQSVKRNQIVLFGKEGIVTDKIAELEFEIKKRKTG